MSHNFKDSKEIEGEQPSDGWYSITKNCWCSGENEKVKEHKLSPNDIQVILGFFQGLLNYIK